MAQYESNYNGSQIDTAVLKITNASSNLAHLGCGIGTCSTAAATAAKVVTLSNYELVTNGIVEVTFSNNVPANATLNINSKGAKPIYYKGSAITADTIKANDTVTFTYDGTNYVVISLGKSTIPYIGLNGNWFVGDTDTGVKAQGATGSLGPLGPQGPLGPTGPAGNVSVGDGSTWYALDHIYSDGRRSYFQTANNQNIQSCYNSVRWDEIQYQVHGDNEFNICDSSPKGYRLWFNYIGRHEGNISVDLYHMGNGRGYATAAVYAGSYNNGSDMRNKNIIENVELNVEDIAKAPLFKFNWIDPSRGNGTYIGSSALYWKMILPNVVSEDTDERKTLSMQYGITAFACSVFIAKKLIQLEEKIKELENTIIKIQNKLNS